MGEERRVARRRRTSKESPYTFREYYIGLRVAFVDVFFVASARSLKYVCVCVCVGMRVVAGG